MNGKIVLQSSRAKSFDLLVYIAIIAAMYVSATPINAIYYVQSVMFFLLVASIVFFRSRKYRLKVNRRTLLFLGAFCGLIILTGIANLDVDITFYMGLIIKIVATYFLMEGIPYEKYKTAYINLFTVLGIYSVLLTLFFNIFRNLVNNLTPLYVENFAYVRWRSFFNIYFIWDLYARHGVVRNSACFREPGVFGSFVSIALMIKILDIKKKKPNKKDFFVILVLVIATCSTLSTTAIFCLILCAAVYFLDKSINAKKFIIIFIGSSVSVFYLLRYGNLLFSKFDSTNTSYIAFYERIEGIGAMVQSWLINPLLGAGYTKYYELVTEGANTISFLVILGEFGPFLLVLMLYALLKFIKEQRCSIFITLCLIIQFCIILNTQYLILMPLILIFMFYGISRQMNF